MKSIELAGRQVTGRAVDVQTGSTGPLRLVLSTRTATLEGKGTPGRHYVVIEDGDNARFGPRHGTMADPQGRIRLLSLAPGKYRIYEGNPSAGNAAVQEFTATEGGRLP
jgi:hypothetical protein